MKKKLLIGGGAFVAVVGLWIANPLVLSHLLPDSLESRGQFGDQFGVINALFSGAALIGVAFALWIQVHELKTQREDLKLQQSELGRSVKAQQKAEEALHKRLDLEESLARRRSTLELFDDWQSPETVAARAQAQVLLRSLLSMSEEPQIPSLSEFERLLGTGSPYRWEVGNNNRQILPPEVQGVWEVVRVFRKWAGLSAAGQVDAELARALLADDAREWDKLLFKNLEFPEPGDPHRQRLLQIRQKVLNPMLYGS